ncbi:hypothetical protein [uncultured Jannaschia sp.]|uniref:hypothetical protein n=1 Tax=uncultured Jannaschia sp. TaxID=293347 RepID=UPI00261B79E3|nr:hypothetical protein [uncultured Jannaschia sp.]
MGRVVLLALAPVLALTACMPTGPEARRAAYLRCARDEGVPVRDGTILSRGPEDLARLDACRAIPR